MERTAIQQGVDQLVLGANGATTGFGSVAQRLIQNGMNINALRTNDVLRKEEWLLFDRTVVEVARANLVGVADLMGAGLRVPIPNAMGVTVIQHETQGDLSPAQVDMSGLTEGERDRLLFGQVNIPLPIVHKEFMISLRNLESSRRMGMPLDTSTAAVATRRVTDTLEDILFNGTVITAGGGGPIQGYTNFTARNTGSVTASWALVGTTGDQIVGDILRMIGDMNTDNMYGPFRLYVPVAVYIQLLKDLKTASDKAILTRILEIPQITGVKPTTRLSASQILLVQFTSDVVEMLDGIQPTTVMWETHGGMLLHFKVIAIMIPRIKSDASGQCGIVHYS
jgi:uncharacterized linocin/CFP29 family protein